MRILTYVRDAFGPDPAAIAAGLTITTTAYGWHYSGRPASVPDAPPPSSGGELPPELADARLIESSSLAYLGQFPELAAPLGTSDLRESLDEMDAAEHAGSRALASAIREARAHCEALYAALTAPHAELDGGAPR